MQSKEEKKMKKTILITLLILTLTGMFTLAINIRPVDSPTPPETEWSRTYGGVANDQARSAVQTSDGGYAIAGFTESFGAGGQDAWLVKTDSSGNHEWNQTYGGTSDDTGGALVQTADGGYAMAGSTKSFGAGGMDFWLIKTDSSGNHEWNQTYGGTSDEGVNWGMVQTGDGGYLMVGTTWSFGAGSGDFWLVKTDSSGNHEWNQTYGGTGLEMAFYVVLTSDGGYAIAGFTESFGAGGRDVWLVKTDSSGNHEWNQTYGEAAWDEGFSVIQKHDGGYAIAGHTRSFGAKRWDWLLLRTDSSGNLLGSPKIYGGAYDDYAHCVRQTSDGGYVIGGSTQVSSIGGDFDGWLVRTDASGNHEWDQTYSGIRRDALNYVVKTWDGGYALAGYTGLSTQAETGYSDEWLIKLAPEEIPATVDIDPDTLNLKSNGEWITCYIELPEGYSVADIDVSTILLNDTIAVDIDAPTQIADYDDDGIEDLMVKFDRASVLEWLGSVDYGGDTGKSVEVTLTVTGEVMGVEPSPFEDSDTVKVLLKG